MINIVHGLRCSQREDMGRVSWEIVTDIPKDIAACIYRVLDLPYPAQQTEPVGITVPLQLQRTAPQTLIITTLITTNTYIS